MKGIKQIFDKNKFVIVVTLIELACICAFSLGGIMSPSAAALWGLLLLLNTVLITLRRKEKYVTSVVLFAYTMECVMQMEIEHWFELSASYQRFLDYGLYVLCYAAFMTLPRRKSSGLILGNIFFSVVSTLNFAVTVFRGKPVYFPDIYSINTAMEFVDDYAFPSSKVHVLCTVILITSVLLCIALRNDELDGNGTIFLRLRKFGCIFIVPVLVIAFRVPTLLRLRGYYFTTTPYWLYSFSMSAYQMNVSKPETYDSAGAAVKENGDEAPMLDEAFPNVIFIMNESFADLRVISSFEGEETVMPYYDKLSADANAVNGELHVSIYGGNTANTEFEVLTGISTYYLPYDTTAYNLYVNSKTESLAGYFKQLGYTTVAFHPSAQTNYNRIHAYPNLGFEYSRFQEDYEDLDTLRTFTSDISNYEKVIEWFESKNSDQRLFMFNLTVQNHGPFNFQDAEFEDKVKLSNPEFSVTQQYLSCIRYSDEALKTLLSYLETYPEPVAVVFFGDHQAKIDDAFYEELFGKKLGELTEDELKKRYIVPYMIWTNYGLEMEDGVDMSANYLGAFVLEQLGLPMTAYQKFLCQLRESYPIITAQGIAARTADLDQEKMLQLYENFCYNILFDKQNLWEDLYRLKEK